MNVWEAWLYAVALMGSGHSALINCLAALVIPLVLYTDLRVMNYYLEFKSRTNRFEHLSLSVMRVFCRLFFILWAMVIITFFIESIRSSAAAQRQAMELMQYRPYR